MLLMMLEMSTTLEQRDRRGKADIYVVEIIMVVGGDVMSRRHSNKVA